MKTLSLLAAAGLFAAPFPGFLPGVRGLNQRRAQRDAAQFNDRRDTVSDSRQIRRAKARAATKQQQRLLTAAIGRRQALKQIKSAARHA